MIDLLRLLPPFWMQNRKTSKPWTDVLSKALDVHGVSDVNKHECKVGPFTVWTSNYPYGFGYNRRDPLELLPSVWVRIKLRRAIERYLANEYALMTWADH